MGKVQTQLHRHGRRPASFSKAVGLIETGEGVDFRGKTGTPYAVATLPAAAQNTGRIVYVSNGAAGQPCLAYSNGTNWLRILLGAAVATS